jgi:Flp pilus assembly protein TadB
MEVSDVFKSILNAVEDAAKKSLAYSRAASFLSTLEAALLISAALATVVYVFAAYWQLIAVAAGLVATAFAANKLGNHYYSKMLKELDKLEMLTIVAALSAGRVNQAKALLREKIGEPKSNQASSN